MIMRMKMMVKQIAIMDCDKGSYTVMKYDTAKCTCTNAQGHTHT